MEAEADSGLPRRHLSSRAHLHRRPSCSQHRRYPQSQPPLIFLLAPPPSHMALNRTHSLSTRIEKDRDHTSERRVKQCHCRSPSNLQPPDACGMRVSDRAVSMEDYSSVGRVWISHNIEKLTRWGLFYCYVSIVLHYCFLFSIISCLRLLTSTLWYKSITALKD